MKRYLIMWMVEVLAPTAEEAAKEAVKVMQDPGSETTTLDITNLETGVSRAIDCKEIIRSSGA